MTMKADTWNCPPGEERVESFKAPVTGKRRVLYFYCAEDGFCFAAVAATVEFARVMRDMKLEALGRTIPKPKRKPAPERVPASECEDARCNCAALTGDSLDMLT